MRRNHVPCTVSVDKERSDLKIRSQKKSSVRFFETTTSRCLSFGTRIINIITITVVVNSDYTLRSNRARRNACFAETSWKFETATRWFLEIDRFWVRSSPNAESNKCFFDILAAEWRCAVITRRLEAPCFSTSVPKPVWTFDDPTLRIRASAGRLVGVFYYGRQRTRVLRNTLQDNARVTVF